MKVQFTCTECRSSIEVFPSVTADKIQCGVCENIQVVSFDKEHGQGLLKNCPGCKNSRFYQQKDFNRIIGVVLFIIAAILSIYTYGISLIVLYLIDLFLFRKIGGIAICYHCQAVFRGVKNLDKIENFNHEVHDRIIYAKQGS